MALTHKYTKSLRSNAGTVTSASYTISGDKEFNVEIENKSIAANTAVDFSADASTIVSIAMSWTPASGSSSCVVYTNDVSGGSPDNTITLLAGKPLLWDTQVLATIGTACPITVDIDAGLFVTNTAIGDLTIYMLCSGS